MGLSAELLSKWGRFSEAQIAQAGPNVLKYYQTHVKPELEKKDEPSSQIIEKPANVRRPSNHLNREDYAPNRLRAKCSFIGFRVSNGEGEELKKIAADQNISLSEFLRQRTMAKSQDSKFDALSRVNAEDDELPRRCMVRFRVSPKEMLFYQQEVEKRGFVTMADFFREAVRRMVYTV